MANQESGVPGGWGAKKGEGGGRVIEPYVPPTYGYDSGTYTDPVTGKPISKKEAEGKGIIDRPGEAAAKIAAAGAARPQAYTPPPIGLEALKTAELSAARQETLRRQSEQVTTPSEALAIQRMLRSPTAQFASQEAAQRGYELASRYDRSFAPEQVRATLAPQYQPQAQQQEKPISFFGPAPREQAGIRPSFATPARPGSLAERAAFERRRSGFYTYGTVRRLEGVSSRLQEGFERTIGYDERSSIPVKAVAGFGSAFTGLPAFAGQVAGAGEAIIRYPSASLRGLPTGFKILSKQVSEQARTKPIEFAGSLAGMAAIGRYAPKVSIPKPSAAGFKAFAKSETAILAPRRATYEPGSIDIAKALRRGVEKGFTGSTESFGSKGYKPTGFKPTTAPEKIPVIPTRGFKTIEMVKVKTQLAPAQPKLRPVMEIERPVILKGLEQGIMTKAEFMASQKKGLRATPLSQLRTLQEVKAPQRVKLSIVPYAQVPRSQPIISTKTKPVTTTKQAVSLQPLTKIKVKQMVSILPKTRTITSTATQTLLKVKPLTEVRTQTKVQTQLQTKTATQTQARMKTEIKENKQRTKSISSMLKKSSSILKGGRKYITKLGGKTLAQLEAELKRKRRK